MRIRTTSTSVATLAALVGAGLMGMFPSQQWIGGLVVLAGVLIFIWDLHIDHGQFEAGSPKTVGVRLAHAWPQFWKAAVAGAIILGGGWLAWVYFTSSATTIMPTPPEEARNNPDNSERIFVQVSPHDIAQEFQNRTTDQANALVSRYIGKWIAISGSVWDISPDKSGGVEIDLGGPNALAIIMSGVFLQLHFSPEWKDRISVLNKGSKINAVCQIDDIQQIGMALGSCELTSSP